MKIPTKMSEGPVSPLVFLGAIIAGGNCSTYVHTALILSGRRDHPHRGRCSGSRLRWQPPRSLGVHLVQTHRPKRAPSLIAVHFIAVLPDERYLTDKFGEGYRSILARVRRYI